MPENGKSGGIKFHALDRFIPEIAGKKWLNRTATEKGPSHISKNEQFRLLKIKYNPEVDMSKQNIYDNESFFENFRKNRDNELNFNDCIETPILLSMLPPLTGKTILDIGCGFGDLLKYLRRRDPDETFGYVGIDIVPEFVEVAKEKNPEYRFLNEDIFEYEPFRKFKYVVECGCFTGLDPQHEDESYAFVEKFIGRMLELCTDDGAVVCHFLSDKVDYRTFATDFHIAPEKILAIAYKFSRRVVLDNSVLPFEACLTIYKDDSFRPETTVFNQAKID